MDDNIEAERPTLRFRPRARIIRAIGDRLISGPEAALIELVKNSHDADAGVVRITLYPPLNQGAGKIVVEDDGHGMTLTDIETKWMEPATDEKVARGTSPRGRRLLGSKGIGRFAAAKLGRHLELQTTALNDGTLKTFRIPDIDWDVFDQTKYLSDIRFDYEYVEPLSAPGTRLTIQNLSETWTEASLRGLHLELKRLISPIAGVEDFKFEIFLDLSRCTVATCGFNGSEIVNGPALGASEDKTTLHLVRPVPLLRSCDYEVNGEFRTDGTFKGSLTIHRGRLAPEPIEMEFPLDQAAGEAPCGSILVHLYIFDREAGALEEAMSRAGMGKMSAKDARQILDSVSGVAIYRDQFRIRPYGDPENDWLTLDMRRVQNPSLRIGHNQVSGLVYIDDEERSGLSERSSREGLEENSSFLRLRSLMTALFDKVIEPRRFAFRENAGLGRRKGATFEKALKLAKLSWVERYVTGLSEPLRSEAQKKITTESSKLTQFLEDLQENYARIQAQVTLGLIIAEVLHEGKAPVAFINDESSRLSRWWPGILNETDEALEQRTAVPSILRGLTTSAVRLRDLFRALSPLSGGRRDKPTYYSPVQVVIDVVRLFKGRCDENGIAINHHADPAVRDVLGFREDLTTALTNLFDNSIYWLEQSDTGPKHITIDQRHTGKSTLLEFIDTGPGIAAEFREHIFEPGFTLKPAGTGLGLAIAQEALSRANAKIELVDDGAGAHFRIEVPYGD